ncbi:MAG: tripartite tricarboxylate transporter substrate binding protein [Gammaproteobacteria bacterium]|nr:tripartite tricarboxylate transporter substrate binding protein [Gammaproteobacteria bacterium]
MRVGVRTLSIAALLSIGACSEPAGYPNKDITIVIPFNSGGGFDTYVRALAPGLERHLPNAINVLPKNLPGAGGRRGASEIFRSKPDGYTIGIFNMPGVLIPQLQNIPTSYELSQVTWLGTLGYDPYIYAVRGDSPLKSIEDVSELQRSVTYGATGPGSTSYVATNIVNERLGIPYEIITGYTGSSGYLLGLVRGDFDAALLSQSVARSYLESGDIRALAIFGSESSDPDVADADDLGAPELGQLRVVRMMGAPPDLPEDIRIMLEEALLASMQDQEFRVWLETTGNDVHPAGAAETEAAVSEMTQFYDQFKQLLD